MGLDLKETVLINLAVLAIIIVIATAAIFGFNRGRESMHVDPDLRMIQTQRNALRMYEEAGKIQP